MAGRENLKQRKGKRTPSSPTGANEDDLPLPPNWERGMKDGKPYYVDHTTKTTTWQHPSLAAVNPLPAGWEQARDANGQVYFINNVNRTTTFDDPRFASPSAVSRSSNMPARQQGSDALVKLMLLLIFMGLLIIAFCFFMYGDELNRFFPKLWRVFWRQVKGGK